MNRLGRRLCQIAGVSLLFGGLGLAYSGLRDSPEYVRERAQRAAVDVDDARQNGSQEETNFSHELYRARIRDVEEYVQSPYRSYFIWGGFGASIVGSSLVVLADMKKKDKTPR